MSKPLVFMMGRSPAFVPVDRQYVRSHYWAIRADEGYRLGLSAYAVKLLGVVHHLQWSVEPGVAVEQGRAVGYIEASKASSDLYAPFSGQIAEINPCVPTEPSLINTRPYDAGWLLTIAGDAGELLSPAQYLAYLEATWPLAQRLLKNQAGKGH
jgi:glycine cleavage system H protein